MKRLEPGPFATLLGIEVVEQGKGTASARLEADERHLNPHGVVHGGALYSLIDQAMGAAVYTLMEPHELCATIDVSVAYLAPGRPGCLTAAVRVVRRTRRLAVLEGEVWQDNRILVKAMGVYTVFQPEEPAQ